MPDDLQSRLKQTRWTDEPKDAGWNYGANPKYLRELVGALNKFLHFKTEIDGMGILEKFYTWSDNTWSIENSLTRDERRSTEQSSILLKASGFTGFLLSSKRCEGLLI